MKNLYEGIKVVDLTNNFAGPTTSALLADYGAEVIHVEKPVQGDDNRYFVPTIENTSFSHISCNRGKKSLEINLKDPEAIKIMKELIKQADIVVESFRPGTLAKIGLGYEDVKEIKPDIIYCSISAFGQKGPYAHRPGYDVIAQAASGLMYMTGHEDGEPAKIGPAVGDWVGALNAFGAIGSAMYYKEKTGKGQYIDISLTKGLMWFSTRFDSMFTGKEVTRMGNHDHTMAPYGIYRGPDGLLVIATLSRKLWTTLCEVIEKPELADDPKFITNDKRCENLDEVISILENWLKEVGSIDTAERLLREAGVPCSKILSMDDIFNDPHYNQCGWITMVPPPDDVRTIPGRYIAADPYEFSEFEPEYKKAPVLGQHNHEILSHLGYSDDEIEKLHEKWVEAAKKQPK